jgi:hypothetical protein
MTVKMAQMSQPGHRKLDGPIEEIADRGKAGLPSNECQEEPNFRRS